MTAKVRRQIKIPPFVKNILDKFAKAGYEIYIVGGAVRDVLMSKETYDWDFTTNATPDEILQVFPEGFYDNKFGTVGLADESHHNPYEITTFRRETGYSDRRRPDHVEWGKSLKEDLARRDFTINAMALRLVPLAQGKHSFEVIDMFGGRQDLKTKLIRAVGNAVERFDEDALRMMRAVRIAAELGFEIEPKTFEAIKIHSASVKHVAWERIKAELFKTLASDNPYEGVMLLYNSGLLEQILPEIIEGFGVEQKSPERHHIYDVGTHCLYALKFCPSRDPLVRFATLIHDIGKPKTQKITAAGVITFYNHEVVGARLAKEIADRLRFSRDERDRLWRLVRWHQFTVSEKQTDTALRRFIRNVGKENVQDMLDLRTGDRLGGGAAETSWRLEEFKERLEEVQLQPFSVRDLKVNGKDIMQTLNIPSGPIIGKILNELFGEVEKDQSRNTREYLLQRIEKYK
ncbi:MAG: poly(A) polymerase [Microgenomates group bacterium Gr01-1014_5]|nr:MAG: poly(A) polymerase [Microgenomates group bacterium Gr01-1014_5]